MNFLDLIIILLIIAVAARGVAAGFLRAAGSLGGFAVGLILGATLAPLVASAFPANASRILVILLVFFGVAIILGGAGESLGNWLSNLAHKYRLKSLDAIFGAAFGVVISLVTIWLLASTFARSQSIAVASEIQNSLILRILDRSLPPAPDVLARLERALGSRGFPRVFTGLEPSPAAPVTGPDAAAINQAAAAGRASTVRVEGLGCGGLLEGSGFVVGPGLVATNAHVVAGIDRPAVVDAAGSHAAQVVEFDPEMDFAVLRTTGLLGPPLTLASANVSRGTVGAALGYPGGGSFTVSSAAVLGRQAALGRDIYDSGLIRRDIYELQAIVRPGNSGGPLITPDGTVIGVVFATSTTNGDIGYALTSAEVRPDLGRVSSRPVSSGPCLAE